MIGETFLPLWNWMTTIDPSYQGGYVNAIRLFAETLIASLFSIPFRRISFPRISAQKAIPAELLCQAHGGVTRFFYPIAAFFQQYRAWIREMMFSMSV